MNNIILQLIFISMTFVDHSGHKIQHNSRAVRERPKERVHRFVIVTFSIIVVVHRRRCTQRHGQFSVQTSTQQLRQAIVLNQLN